MEFLCDCHWQQLASGPESGPESLRRATGRPAQRHRRRASSRRAAAPRRRGAPDPVTGERQRSTRSVSVKGKREAQQELGKLLTELGRQPRHPGTRARSVADACDA